MIPLPSNNISESIIFTPEQTNHINQLLHKSKADNTIRAYQSDWKNFVTFCNQHNFRSLPAVSDTVVLYLSELSKTHKYSTIKRKVASINKAHISANQLTPINHVVKELLNGIARTIGHKQTPKTALILDDLKTIIDNIDVSTIAGKRDKALILVGFTTASRRSELVLLNVEDISFTPKGMDISIYESKNNAYVTKSVLLIANAYCPVSAVNEWLLASQIKTKAIFRSISKTGTVNERLTEQSVANIIKKYASISGLDPTMYAAHSLRSGLATSAAMEGYSESEIMHQTAHNTHEMVGRYIQNGRRYHNNVSNILNKL
ncbi:tyrosine-type recombinase/integrase [Paenibacillus sp. N1-5-1-14]|uniref:tyrosine-type recombinase/integrase n=1 Tax=Paenibacillus radicibacter TaxID=2972488 RepID=UPI002159B4DD|nr:tyrosine-type recombinase/integrase [Paenibacillus radicibacter]MCR8641524.1 tyrosine-type recombinase/integrase [Paenibacillus radicibacter]